MLGVSQLSKDPLNSPDKEDGADYCDAGPYDLGAHLRPSQTPKLGLECG